MARAKPVTFEPYMLKFMRDVCKTMSVQDCAIYLDLTPKQVANKAQREGISFQKHGSSHHKSTVSNDDARYARLLIDDGEMCDTQIDELLGLRRGYTNSIRNGKIRANEQIQIN